MLENKLTPAFHMSKLSYSHHHTYHLLHQHNTTKHKDACSISTIVLTSPYSLETTIHHPLKANDTSKQDYVHETVQNRYTSFFFCFPSFSIGPSLLNNINNVLGSIYFYVYHSTHTHTHTHQPTCQFSIVFIRTRLRKSVVMCAA